MNSIRIIFVAALLFMGLGVRCEAAENQLEKWYTYWGLGISDIKHPEPFDGLLNLLEVFPGVTRTQLNLDLLGFYKPVNTKMMAGFVVNGAADRTEVEGEGSMQVNLYTYAATVQYFPKEIGKGLFCRGDFGIASANVSIDDEDQGSSDFGLGLLVGIGYAHPITAGTRLALNLNYASRSIEGDNWGTVGISLGGLF